MKKQLAQWLLKLARRIDPQKEFKLAEAYEPKKLGIGYHISKKDVRDWRKHNPQYKSHREALAAMIEDTKREINFNIVQGIYKNGLINYNVKKSLWVADVTGDLYVYAKSQENDGAEAKD